MHLNSIELTVIRKRSCCCNSLFESLSEDLSVSRSCYVFSDLRFIIRNFCLNSVTELYDALGVADSRSNVHKNRHIHFLGKCKCLLHEVMSFLRIRWLQHKKSGSLSLVSVVLFIL